MQINHTMLNAISVFCSLIIHHYCLFACPGGVKKAIITFIIFLVKSSKCTKKSTLQILKLNLTSSEHNLMGLSNQMVSAI